MPGYNRTQDALISATDLATALQAYSVVPTKILADAAALQNELLRKNFKKPSVFASGNILSSSWQYPLVGSDPWSQRYLVQVASVTVFVFNIQDADIVKINVQIACDSSPFFQCSYALSPSDGMNAIPASEFCSLSNFAFSEGVPNPVGISLYGAAAAWDEIACAGNKYLHVFGVTPILNAFQSDLMPAILDNPDQSQFSFSLIK
jgi:hypothetical protein